MLLITPEPVGERMAGPAIRCLELGRALARSGGAGPVTVASLSSAELSDPDVRVLRADAGTLRGLVAEAGSVVIQGDVLGLHPWLADVDVPLVVDVYDPFHLEQLERARGQGGSQRLAVTRDAVRSLNVQLARADFVLCASERQRALWLGHLSALGRVNPLTYDRSPQLSELLAVVPFGVPTGHPQPVPRRDIPGWPSAVGETDPVVLWAGGLYDWLDPLTVVRGMHLLREQVPDARLIFLGVQHPVDRIVGAGLVTEVERVAAELDLLDRTVFLRPGWVPYEQRGAWLSAADLTVSTHHEHLETEFSFRTRLLDSVWAGKPGVVTAGDDVGSRLVTAGAALEVPPEDPVALAGAVATYLTDPTARRTAADAARSLAEAWRWPALAQPLADFCAKPRRAPDLLLSPTDRAVLGPWGPQHAGRPSPRLRVAAALREGGLPLLARRVGHRVRGDRG